MSPTISRRAIEQLNLIKENWETNYLRKTDKCKSNSRNQRPYKSSRAFKTLQHSAKHFLLGKKSSAYNESLLPMATQILSMHKSFDLGDKQVLYLLKGFSRNYWP